MVIKRFSRFSRFAADRRLRFALALLLSLTVATSQAGAAAGCGPAWRATPVPGLGVDAALSDVAVIGTGEAWAVGTETDRGLIGHFSDGSWTWTRYGVPGKSVSLRSVAARPGVAWAVGQISGISQPDVALILVNTGTGWRRQPVPLKAVDAGLRSVVIRTASDVWMSGTLASTFQTVALHWDGSRLRVTTVPDVVFASGIEAPREGGAVLVGENTSGNVQAWHWNGSVWREDRMPPGEDFGEAFLANVDSTNGQMWATGTAFGGCCTALPRAFRWAGTRWVANDPPTGIDLVLSDVLVSRIDGHVTVVGRLFCDSTVGCVGPPNTAAIWEWTGSVWKQQPTGLAPDQESELVALDGDGQGGRWAVGSHVVNQQSHPLLLRQCVPPS